MQLNRTPFEIVYVSYKNEIPERKETNLKQTSDTFKFFVTLNRRVPRALLITLFPRQIKFGEKV